ncbi:hypothetical protein MY10362_005782 [Beauveria mimosiformis]
MLWLPWSLLGWVAAFCAVLDVCHAHNPKDNFRGDSSGPERVTLKRSEPEASITSVYICENNPLNPPCTTVDAPNSQCVAIPQEYKNTVSGVRLDDATSICRFHLEPDCNGKYFEASSRAIDIYSEYPTLNDKVASFTCNTTKQAAPERWEWPSKSQKQSCTHLDNLSLDFKLGNNLGSGTYDTIKLGFEDAGLNVHVITEGPWPGYKVSQDINMLHVFGAETVALSQINRLTLLDELTDWSFGGDVWEINGFTLRGRCAGSAMNIALEKFSSLNKWLQAQPNQPGRFQYHRDWQVWAGDVKPEDWVIKSVCKTFKSMKVSLCMSPMQTGI